MIHARDLFDQPVQPPKRRPTKLRLTRPEPAEAQVLRAVRQALQWHRAVAHVWRVNCGLAWMPGREGNERPVRFHDIDGCSDLIGIMKDGRWLAVECKRPSKRASVSTAQQEFLAKVRAAGGVAFVAATIDDVMRELSHAGV